MLPEIPKDKSKKKKNTEIRRMARKTACLDAKAGNSISQKQRHVKIFRELFVAALIWIDFLDDRALLESLRSHSEESVFRPLLEDLHTVQEERGIRKEKKMKTKRQLRIRVNFCFLVFVSFHAKALELQCKDQNAYVLSLKYHETLHLFE